MPYAILRFKKCKMGGINAAYAHNERKKESYKSNPDIMPERKAENYHLVLPKQTYRREVQRLIHATGCKTRSNSTVIVETLITASPEFMGALSPPEQREFFQRALEFVGSRVGTTSYLPWCMWTRKHRICTFPFAPSQKTPKAAKACRQRICLATKPRSPSGRRITTPP